MTTHKTAPQEPKAGVHAYVIDLGRAYVESLDLPNQKATVRFDANLGRRSRCYTFSLDCIDFSREWKFL